MRTQRARKKGFDTLPKLAIALALGCAALAAQAQQPASDLGAAPNGQPRWMQGQPPELAKSTLHPLAPHMTGRPASELPISKLKVPAGFKVEVWADGLPNARFMARGDKGTIFVSTLALAEIYAITEHDGKREVKTLLKGLDAPNGIAFREGSLYVAEQTRITRYDNIESQLDNPPAPKVVMDGFPKQVGHFWKYITFGPDGKLYVNVGSPGNIVMPGANQASIFQIDAKAGTMESYATGVRNSVGFAFHPVSKQMWFTEHGRDWMGDDMPSDELNVATRKGQHFGFPYCHQGDTLDPVYGKNRTCAEFVPPALKLGGHVAPLGLAFYTGRMFPAEYRNNLFVAQHGSWNRTTKHGYDVIRVVVDGAGKVLKSEPFLEGFLENPNADPPMWGRPVAVMVMPDGALMVSDDYNGILYRVSYKK
jgi:glucose/arabinose dehydrogenase